MKRFKTISLMQSNEIIDYDIPKDEYTESITDTSHFIPTSEAVKQLGRIPALSADVINAIYDFKDGKDNGMKIPLTRKPGADIAEVSQSVRAQQSEIKSEIAKAEKKARTEQLVKDLTNGGKTSGISNNTSVSTNNVGNPVAN